jgi:ubiquinone/menaquinone biosynthesis C-methylase UbiE
MARMNRLEHYRSRYKQLIPSWAHATVRYQDLIAKCIKPNFRVLDLGCGRGGVVERLGDTATWMGIDPDFRSLKLHRRVNFARCCADASTIPIAKNSIDIVAASWVLEHLSEPEMVFTEIARVLRPGGHFFFLTPNIKHPLPLLSRMVANNLAIQQVLVQHLYHRMAVDTFSVQYNANTWKTIDAFAAQVGLWLVEVELVDDPSYLAWDTFPFGLAILAGSLLPANWNIHMVGHYRFYP